MLFGVLADEWSQAKQGAVGGGCKWLELGRHRHQSIIECCMVLQCLSKKSTHERNSPEKRRRKRRKEGKKERRKEGKMLLQKCARLRIR